MAAPPAEAIAESASPSQRRRRILIRIGALAVTGVSLYLLAPALLDTFSSWPKLRDANPWWFLLALGFEVLSRVALWTLQRIALRTRSWFAVATSQLAAGAAGSVVPGGGAAATALQYGLLVRAGIPGERVASGLTASFALTTACALALPVIAMVAAVGGAATPRGLRQVAYLGAAGFVLVVGVSALVFARDEPLRAVGRAARAVAGRFGKRDRVEDLPERLLRQRDAIRAAFSAHPILAALSGLGKWIFDYLALVCVLLALGERPEPALVLLAYAAASLLGMIPITPGGLGFVEAGLAGLLGLAGVGAGPAAVATLAYRLVSFWLPLPAGGIAYVVARRRYGDAGSSSRSSSSSTSDATTSPP
jgi:uncharacterized protein (TIRG00374 family)